MAPTISQARRNGSAWAAACGGDDGDDRGGAFGGSGVARFGGFEEEEIRGSGCEDDACEEDVAAEGFAGRSGGEAWWVKGWRGNSG